MKSVVRVVSCIVLMLASLSLSAEGWTIKSRFPRRNGGHRVMAARNLFSMQATLAPEPATSFAALGDDGTRTPPDTNGAVGPDHVLSATNAQVRIQSKSGVTASTVSLNTFFGTTGVFAPRVSYDRAAARWIVVALSGTTGAASKVLIAVSATSDPTGTWNVEEIPADQDELGASADAPIVGYNDDLLAISVNLFADADASYVRAQMFVLDKSDLYAGTPSFVYYGLGLENEFAIAPAVSLDAGAALHAVESGSGTYGELRLFRVDQIDLTYLGTVTGPAWSLAGGDNSGPQSGGTGIHLGDDRIVNAVFQNGFLYAAQTAFLPADTPSRAAVQYWKIDPDLSSAQQVRVDDATGAASYAFPSIAVNEDGDVLVGFSMFSSTQYASAAYSYRKATDGAGTTGAAVIFKAGEATYSRPVSGLNRWGSVSATVVDPANDEDFWTIQEYAETPVSAQSRWGTWWARVATGAAVPAPSSLVATGSGTSVTLTWNPSAGASSYAVERRGAGSDFVAIATVGEPGYVDAALGGNAAYLYRVRAIAPGVSAYSNVDAATTFAFTNDPLASGTAIRKTHIMELRNAVNALRAAAGLTAFVFADDDVIRKIHLDQLRANVNAAREAAGMAPVSFTDATLTAGVTAVKAAHVTELRNAVK